MGLLSGDDWQGEWISARQRDFHVHREVERARVYLSGLGFYELYVKEFFDSREIPPHCEH